MILAAAILWLLLAALLLTWLAPDIMFAVTELRDPWSGTILVALALFWPISIFILCGTVARDFVRSQKKC